MLYILFSLIFSHKYLQKIDLWVNIIIFRNGQREGNLYILFSLIYTHKYLQKSNLIL